VAPREVDGIHEVQAGDLENRNDDEAIAELLAWWKANGGASG
jgi:probable phosphoglycerate mutase